MLPKPESACFVIADISGYTSFVSGVELDHAQDIIADIMDTLVKAVTLPTHRPRWQRSDGVVESASKGRRGAGTQNHCLHGKDAIIEDIVDWRPFDYATLATLLPIPGAPKILMTYAFEERKDGGTHFEFRVAKPKPKDLPFYEQIWPTVQGNYTIGFQTLRAMLDEQPGSPAVVDEPPLPASADRFLTEPVHAR